MNKEVWGGRFKKGLDPEIKKFTSSITYDKRLAPYDIKGSIAHAKMLGKCKIISRPDSTKIAKGLSKITKKLKTNMLVKSKYEDIHLAVTSLLEKEIGKVAGKLHIARSRNDQVNLDLRMYCKDEIGNIVKAVHSLQACILKGAKKFSAKNTTMPSYTHLQHAQCILLSHQLLAYIGMLERDKERLDDAYKRVDVMPLGSSANRGTALPIDRFYVAKQLGFSKVSENSIDAVSDRDFVAEFLSGLAILSMHLSRIAEDFIIWSSDEFHYFEGDDAHYTGSSMMPNKKNPDPLELIRGYSGQIYGNLMSILVVMKGLPHTYNRDMQLDKPALFNAIDVIKASLPILEKVLYGIKIDENAFKDGFDDEDYIFATDICEYLEKKGYSCWKAHEITGNIVRYCIDNDKFLRGLSDTEIKKFSKDLNAQTIKKLVNPIASVNSVKSYGGTSSVSVKRQIKKWSKKLSKK